MADPILPRDLDAAPSVPSNASIIIDNGVTVQKATPAQVADTARPFSNQAEAEAGTDNAKTMTPLRTAQAIDARGYDGLIDGKEPVVDAGTTGQYYRGDKSWQALNKAAVGLGSADDTADADKPVSTAQQTALDDKTTAAAIGISGTATDMGPGGDILTDNADARTWFAELEDAILDTPGTALVKANATAIGVAPTDANMGTTPGSILSDNGSAKDWFEESEAAIEARMTTAKLASSGTGDGADAVNFDGKTISPESVEADGDNSFGTGFDKVQAFRGRITLGALSGPMSFGDLQYCGIQNFGRYDIDGNYAAIQHTTDDSCALFGFFKARGSQTSPSTVVVNDDVGELSFHAWDGSTFVKGALVTPIVKSVASGIISMSIRFWTMDSSGALVNAVDIDETQKLIAKKGIDAKWTTAGGSAIRAYYDGSSGGGAEIRTSNGFSSTVPVYGFWFNSASGIGNPAANVVSVIINGAEALRVDGGNLIFGGTTAYAKTTLNGSIAHQPPVYTASTSYSVGSNDYSVIFTAASTITATLPSAAAAVGRILRLKTIGGGAVNSASSNVSPLAGGAAGTAILAATAGKWVDLQSDGTNWVILSGN